MFPTIDFTAKPTVKYDTAIIGVFEDKKLTASAKTIDSVLGGVLSHQLSSHKSFEAKEGHSLTVALSAKAPYLRVILVGLGDAKKTNEQGLETTGGILASALKTQGSQNAIFLNADDLDLAKFEGHSATAIGYGALLGHYEFNHYKTTMPKPKTKLARLTFLTNDDKKLAKEFVEKKNLAESTCLVRDVVNQPPNILYPETFANHIKKTLTPLGVKVEILSKAEIKKRGMGLLYAVGQASEFEPRLVVMTWPGTTAKKGGKAVKSKQKPIAFVGKGMTYDSGGLSIKPADYMMTMKGDMAGAGAVFGLMHMLAKRKCSYPVIGITPLAENAISDEAYRPDDIIKSYSGKYVEVLNTDAEGRLILADALTYVQKHYDPALVVNLATLTGAILVALGTEYAGTFVNDDGLWDQLNKASNATGEKLWRMPLADHFRREMDTPMADIKNIGAGRYGGSCTAAAFLQEFIDKDRKWAHLDIAGTATTSKPRATNPVPFGTGYGVRLLNNFMKENYG
jgi:leucyl aminopeptidase